MRTLAVVPIRSGSTRVKNKNIMLVDGKPLFSYTVDKLLKITSVSDIIVTTDSHEYKELVEKIYGNKVYVRLRSSNISGNTSTLEESVIDVMYIMQGIGKKYDSILLVQVTSPLTNINSIIKGIRLLKDKVDINSVGTYRKFNNFFIDNVQSLTERPRTQDKIPQKIETGCFWVFRTDYFLNLRNRIIKPIEFIEVSQTEALDIDTSEDMFIVESVVKNTNKNINFETRECSEYDLRDSHHDVKEDPDGKKRDHSKETENKYGFYKEEIDFINGLDSGNFLDLGCGRGFFLDCINDRFNKYALEVSGSYYMHINERLRPEKIHIGDLNPSTYEENLFDVIFCGHVIEHVIEPENFLIQIKRILKQHGNLIISTPDFGSVIAKRFGENFRMLHDKTHISLFNTKTLKNLLDKHGFHVDEVRYPFFDTKYFTQENLFRIFDTSKVSPPFHGNILTMYCRKK
jgi:CMP-N-acetylneuraminic acid synthetase/SAM-dependent methyltransferase